MKFKKLAFYISATLALTSLRVGAEEVPPDTWQEHWFEHNQVVSKFYSDNDVIIYYDKDVNRNINWMNKFTGDVWRYTKQTYGSFGGKEHLYAVFHAYKYGGGHPSTWWDAHHDYRNVIDMGQAGDWETQGGWNIGIITHEISHIVELGSKGVHGSPAFGIWKDSKWAEIYHYDVLLNLGMTALANEAYNNTIKNVDNFPRANTYWFRDWFYPLYSKHGGNKVLNRYFELVAQHFPKNGNSYARDMNWGEFVWFWSGAAGADLKPLATQAFGWPAEWEAQYVKAQADFKFTTTKKTNGPLTIYQHCDFGGYSVGVAAGNYNLGQLQPLGFVNDDMSSFNIAPGFLAELFADDNFTGTLLNVTNTDNCLANENLNDKVTSLRLRPNGTTGLAGRYYIKNKNSGLYLDVQDWSLQNGAKVLQWHYHGGTNQQFDLVDQGNGAYALKNVNSGKTIDISGVSADNGAGAVQWDFVGGGNQKFVAHKSGASYQLVAVHTGKVLELSGNNATPGSALQQWENANQPSSFWELVPTTSSSFNLTKEAESYSSMAGVQAETTIDPQGGGQNVGWIDTNDWMAYNSITIPTSGNYSVKYRVASPNAGGKLSLDLNANAIALGSVDIPNTGGWQNWTTVTQTVYLNAGTYSLGIFAQTGGWNINWFQITSL